jgi:hypothetical protein
LRPFIVNDNGDYCRQVQSSHRENMQESPQEPEVLGEPASKLLTPEAARALAEAAHRRKTAQKKTVQKEIGGRGGPDPARYGDWEAKGIAHDF